MLALVFGRGMVWLRGAWASGRMTPLLCRETALELLDLLAYPKFKLTLDRRDELLPDYMPYAEVVGWPEPEPVPALQLECRDFDDEMSLHLAVAGEADCLVTGDGDLLARSDVAPVKIVTVRAAMALLG